MLIQFPCQSWSLPSEASTTTLHRVEDNLSLKAKQNPTPNPSCYWLSSHTSSQCNSTNACTATSTSDTQNSIPCLQSKRHVPKAPIPQVKFVTELSHVSLSTLFPPAIHSHLCSLHPRPVLDQVFGKLVKTEQQGKEKNIIWKGPLFANLLSPNGENSRK